MSKSNCSSSNSLGSRKIPKTSCEKGACSHIFNDSHVGKRLYDLKRAAYSSPSNGMRFQFVDQFARQKKFGLHRGEKPSYSIDQCCFPSTIGANEANNSSDTNSKDVSFNAMSPPNRLVTLSNRRIGFVEEVIRSSAFTICLVQEAVSL